MSDSNTNSTDPNGQSANRNPQGQPEYGAYAQPGRNGQYGQSDGSGQYGQPNAPYGQQQYTGQQPYAGQPDAQYGQSYGGQPGQQGQQGQQYYGQNPYGQVPYGQPYAYDPNGAYQDGQGGSNTNPYQQGQQYQQQYQQNPYQQYQQSQPNTGQPNAPYDQWFNPDQPFRPFKLIEEMLPQQAKNTIRVLYGVIGVAAVALGIALLLWPGKTLTVFAIILGIYFVVSGAIRTVSAIVQQGLPSGWRFLDVIIGVLLVLGGIVVMRNAVVSGQTLLVVTTMIVGIGWMMEGTMALVESWHRPKSGWAIAYAIISIIAGLVILFSPLSSAVWLVMFSGFALIFMGISSIVRAFKFGKTPKL